MEKERELEHFRRKASELQRKIRKLKKKPELPSNVVKRLKKLEKKIDEGINTTRTVKAGGITKKEMKDIIRPLDRKLANIEQRVNQLEKGTKKSGAMTKELAKKLKERAKEHEREARMLESRKYGTKWKELTERLFDLRDEYPELSGAEKEKNEKERAKIWAVFCWDIDEGLFTEEAFKELLERGKMRQLKGKFEDIWPRYLEAKRMIEQAVTESRIAEETGLPVAFVKHLKKMYNKYLRKHKHEMV